MPDHTLVEILREQAQTRGEHPAFTFLFDGETQRKVTTYAQLDLRARAIAATLTEMGAQGKRALLLYAPEMEYVLGFLGCVFAGVVAVPAYPPDPSRLERTLPRLRSIAQDAGAEIVLTTSEIRTVAEFLFAQAPELAEKTWISTDEIHDEIGTSFHPEVLRPDALAFIQYTSGSTGAPKGVVLTHDNLRTNLSMIVDAFGATRESVGFSWLPPYHDMGLIGGILGPIACGGHSALISPIAFLKRPMRWLEGISRFKASISGGPNFAYELCLRRATDDDIEQLDLSSWELAFSGAEPVRPDTLDRFVERFERCGFRRSAFYPCYGLAEATLIVTGGDRTVDPIALEVDAGGLERGIAKARNSEEDGRLLVSCGRPLGGQKVLLVDPSTRQPTSKGRVGEVWVSGPSVSAAYWNREDATSEALQAELEPSDGRLYLRTGDLAFEHDGEIFITGRLKDLIIVRGRNLYPQDLERTAEESHPALRRGCSAAFSMVVDGAEEVVIAVELERRYRERRRNTQPPPGMSRRKGDRRAPAEVADMANVGATLPQPSDMDLVCETVRRTVAEQHDVRPYIVVLVKAGSLPKTSSGKIQRSETRRMLEAEDLDVLMRNELEAAPHSLQHPPLSSRVPLDEDSVRQAPKSDRRSLVERHLREVIAAGLGRSPESVPHDVPVAQLGLDSLAAVEITHELERHFGAIIPSTALLRDGTLRDLAQLVASKLGSAPPDGVSSTSCVGNNGLSSGQEGLWLLHQLAPESAGYNVSCCLRLVGSIADDVLRGAVASVAERHDVLRMRYPRGQDGGPAVAYDSSPPEYTVVDANGWTDGDLDRRAAKDAHRPFDLAVGPLLRITRYVRGQDSLLLVSTHHIALDFWSMTMLLEQLSDEIRARIDGRSTSAAPGPKYADFVAWQRQRVRAVHDERLAFWREQLAAPLPRIELPLDRPRPRLQSFRGRSVRFEIPAEIVKKVRMLAMDSTTTPFVVLLSAFQLLLSRWTGNDDIAVATPSSGRVRADFSSLVGLLINPVVIRNQIDHAASFRHFVDDVKGTVLDALDRQDFPFAEVVKGLSVERDPSRSPLLDVMFTYEQGQSGKSGWAQLALGLPAPPVEWGAARVESHRLAQRSSQNDLTMMVADTSDGHHVWVHYCADLFEGDTVRRFCEHYVRLLAVATTRPNAPVAELSLLTRSERAPILEQGKGPAVPIVDAPLDRQILRQAAAHPDRVAIACDGHALTYREMASQATRLAARLRDAGVKSGSIVGVLLPRSVDLPIAQLAVMMASGAFLPMDAELPDERILYMLERAEVRTVVTTSELAPRLGTLDLQRLLVDEPHSQQVHRNQEHAPGAHGLHNLAYVMFTSGSTGQPKGVMVEHRSLVSFMGSMTRALELTPEDVLAAVTTSSFDISVLELFLPWLVGARVELLDNDDVRDARRLQRALQERKVTVMQATPSLWSMLEEVGGAPGSVRALCGGEALPQDLASKLASRHGVVVNLYGPTETTIWSTADRMVGESAVVTLGKAIENTTIYVLDDRLEPVPPGVRGEIYIGGANLARGYLHQARLTADRFLPDPFSDVPGARMYRTGDVARRRNGGRVEFLGRRDNQVKIRGHRIELGEIERVLASHLGVHEAAAVVVDGPTGAGLMAFATRSKGAAVGPAQLAHHLSSRLPRYMVPGRVLLLDELPRNANGKLDRRALAAIAPEAETTATAVAPSSERERVLLEVFSDVLGVSSLGVDQDFFVMGGHSILAARAASRISNEFGVELSVRAIFECPTVGMLAARLESTGAVKSSVRRGGALFKKIDRAPRRKQAAAGKVGGGRDGGDT